MDEQPVRAVIRTVTISPRMCGQKEFLTGMPCARMTGGIVACKHHKNSPKRYLIQLVRKEGVVLRSSPFFLHISHSTGRERAFIAVSEIVCNGHTLYAVDNSRGLHALEPDDVIETYPTRRHSGRVVREIRIEMREHTLNSVGLLAFDCPTTIWSRLRYLFGRPALPQWINPAHIVRR